MNSSQVRAVARHALSAAGGIAVTFGIMKQVDFDTLTSALNQISVAVASIATALGVIAPIVSSVWASSSASTSNQIAKAAAAIEPMGGTIVASPEIAASLPAANVVSSEENIVVKK